MQLYSRGKLLPDNEVSLLGVVETVAVSATSVWYAWSSLSYVHVLLAACFAPFLLLRTDRSVFLSVAFLVRIGRGAWDAYIGAANRLRSTEPIPNGLVAVLRLVPLYLRMIFMGVFYIVLALGAQIAKVAATLRAVAEQPLESISAIPQNWARVCFRYDSFTAPEIVPGFESYIEKSQGADFGSDWTIVFRGWRKNVFEVIKEMNSPLAALLHSPYLLISVLYGVALYVPATIYRYSVKSSGVVYLPLVWLVAPRKQSLSELLITVAKTDIEKLKRWYAWLVIGIAVAGAWITFQVETSAAKIKGTPLVAYFIPVVEIDSWHITRVVGAALTIGIYLVADKILKTERETSIAGGQRKLFFDSAIKLRTICTLWTIACGIYIVFRSVDWSALPAIRWLPG